MDLGVRDGNYLIVGGTAGMGLAAARVLAADGARLVLVGRDKARAVEAAASVDGPFVVAVTGDVGQKDWADRIVAEAVEKLGGLDGIAVTTGTSRVAHSTLGDSDDDVWQNAFDDVLMGTIRSVKAALPYLVEGGGGTVVTTAAYSIRAFHPARLPYVVMKSGVAAFTKTVAKEFGSRGVRANCVCPGVIETGSLAAMRQMLAECQGTSTGGAPGAGDGRGVAHECGPGPAGTARRGGRPVRLASFGAGRLPDRCHHQYRWWHRLLKGLASAT